MSIVLFVFFYIFVSVVVIHLRKTPETSLFNFFFHKEFEKESNQNATNIHYQLIHQYFPAERPQHFRIFLCKIIFIIN